MVTVNLDTLNTALEVVLGAAAVGGLVLAGLRRFIRAQLRAIREDTKQLRHNGGSHVADYAKDARDIARRVERQVADLAELVDDAGSSARTAARTAEDTAERLERHVQDCAIVGVLQDLTHKRNRTPWRKE